MGTCAARYDDREAALRMHKMKEVGARKKINPLRPNQIASSEGREVSRLRRPSALMSVIGGRSFGRAR